MQYSHFNASIIAANRFGYGAKSTDNVKQNIDAKAWLKSGLIAPDFDNSLPTSISLRQQLYEYQQQRKKAKKQGKELSKEQKSFPRQTYIRFIDDSFTQVVNADHTIQWRLLDFFSNHFSVTAQSNVLNVLAPTLEREAIAPNLFGNFEDLLVAVVKHPAMLLYLNNERSFGPNSKMGKRGKGLNENLAREILELHTLGVNGGYTQQDVIELAKGITGWSIAYPAKEPDQGFVFREKGHEPGSRKLLSRTYKKGGVEQGELMLKDIAQHASTRHFICKKLASHFVSDNPPKSLLDKLEVTWQKTNGNIKQVMTTLIDAEESWSASLQKYKTPRDFVLSSMRLLPNNKYKGRQVQQVLKQLGQAPFKAGSPAGFADTEADWMGANAVMTRIDLAMNVASRFKANAEQLLATALSNTVSELTYLSVVRAESRKQATAMLLLSPEFQRR
ncbi:DUF1800 domain-containing protein [Psychrosphaera sp. B3R10]|uniref:DUF1800 domain-containing protein n=1 Tax=unclassified Psychrosphaera TaxID=2641570 RepID=UPI001C09DBD2|nr:MULTISPECIES: DUF1800 domain-containing protein [unclassified Psychrosphaera]MBU2880844.1 DUF1800 domain-containing protein [Psychrosphaera sp. I2R16]MBU2990937.1 DUF1800 domain-containing protein [Psychrosphaera sp. B3R10]